MKKFTLLLSIGLFFTFMLKAEEILRGAKANQKIENAELIRYKEGVGAPVFIRFQKDKGPLASHLSAWLDQHYGTNGSFTFTTIIEEEDQKGFTHIKMQQLVGGIVVEHAILKAHVLNGRVHSMNGYVLVDPVFTSHLLSEAQSLEGALNKIRASSYKWEIAGEEQHLKMMTNNPNASYYPVGEKVFLPAAMDFTSQKLIPCYKFDIYAHEPIYRADVYVSAITGEVVFEDMTIKHVDSMGTAVTSFSGTQSITTNYNSVSGTFSLSETGRGNGIRTYDMLNTTNTNNAVSFSNTTNFWKDTLRYRYATDAHWGAEMVYDYYMTVHNRNSLDNNGFALISYVHYGSGYNNAFWNGTAMHYGDGSGSSLPYTTLDICGHEVSHGLTSNTADLVYQYEPGALNESFSDIFGCAIEISVKPNAVKNWLMGEDRGNHIRNMGNPNQKADPDTYLGTYWATGTADNGGVHTNSGVQNYWFYLLTLGGSGTNDNNDVFSVAGLGVAKSEAIAFRNLTVYLTPSSDYSDARFYSIESAIDLFGPCSPEMESTENAWYAVGVGPAYTPGVVSDFSATRTEACVLPAEIGFINLCNNNAQTFIWDFGDGQTSTAENPVHIYRTPGTYTVK
ncbi:MAG TPA: hypothetical protein DCX54_09100, partial [Flavobacteriales bacterium]|nr:hypothetical protein [Flavobacteriales bacterium]